MVGFPAIVNGKFGKVRQTHSFTVFDFSIPTIFLHERREKADLLGSSVKTGERCPTFSCAAFDLFPTMPSQGQFDHCAFPPIQGVRQAERHEIFFVGRS